MEIDPAPSPLGVLSRNSWQKVVSLGEHVAAILVTDAPGSSSLPASFLKIAISSLLDRIV
jgi:hypothetical protein